MMNRDLAKYVDQQRSLGFKFRVLKWTPEIGPNVKV